MWMSKSRPKAQETGKATETRKDPTWERSSHSHEIGAVPHRGGTCLAASLNRNLFPGLVTPNTAVTLGRGVQVGDCPYVRLLMLFVADVL